MDLNLTENNFVNLVWVSFINMIHLTGGIILLGLCLGILEGISNRFLLKAFGRKGILFTAWIGTPVHELSHAIMCFIFHHQVEKIKLLELHRLDGTLGYVEHRYNPASLYQNMGNFFIGIAPLLGGAFTIIVCMYFTVPDSYQEAIHYLNLEVEGESVQQLLTSNLESIWFLIKSLFRFHHFLSPLFWVFLFLAICISSNMALSKADMKGAASGITAIFILMMIVNSIVRFLHIQTNGTNWLISRFNIYVLTLLGVALIFSLFSVLVSYILFAVKGMIGTYRK